MNLAQFQLIEQTNTLYRKTTLVLFFTSLTLYSIALFTLWFYHPAPLIITWYIASVSILTLRYYNKTQYLKNKITLNNYKKWLNGSLIYTLLLGLTWACLFLFSINAEHLLELLVLTTIYFALTSTSSTYLGVYLPAYLTFIVPPTLFFILKLVFIGGSTYYTFAALLLVYFVFITTIARSTHAATQNVSKLTYDNNLLFDDVVAQKELAENAVLAKSQFLAAASHDLRQPLHAQGLFVTALEHSPLSPQGKTLAGKIKSSNDALSSLLNGLLDISQLDSDNSEYQTEEIALDPILQQIHQQYFDCAAENETEFELKVEPNLFVLSDKNLFSRLIRNLVDNAVKFTDNGKISISSEIEDGNILLSISDTGKGIPENELQNVFNEFTQLDNPERDRQKGLGLGLAIVKRISHRINAPIGISSRVGKGTTFTLTLPLGTQSAIQENQHDEQENANTNHSLNGQVVVVIDDEKTILDGMKIIIEQWQAAIVTAENAEQAIEKLDYQGLQPSLILSDLRLRDGDSGIDAIMKLRTEFNAPLKAIIITGDTAVERIEMAEKANMPLLHKPVDSELLYSTISDLLDE